MRRMLGILGEQATADPMPGLDALEELLDQVRAAGLTVELSVAGDRVRSTRARAVGLPDHPGGAHEHVEARPRRPGRVGVRYGPTRSTSRSMTSVGRDVTGNGARRTRAVG